MKKIPIIDVTDLYHPHQDVGDNVDIIIPYALEEIDLKSIILDATDNFRQPASWDVTGCVYDDKGPREPGIIPVNQLNYIFNKNIPYGTTPFQPMSSCTDALLTAPAYQQHGIELILDTLKNSQEKVEILSFGSLRAIAAAYNRNPKRFEETVNKIHLCAGSASSDFVEWNINLDPFAAICLLKSSLPIYIYPCAGENNPYELSQHNSYWKLNQMSFLKSMDVKLKRYLQYALTRSKRIDFLRAMEEEPDETVISQFYTAEHQIWETAVWLEVTGRKLTKRKSDEYRILKSSEINSDDTIIKTEMKNCILDVKENGGFDFKLTDKESNFKIFYRENPIQYQTALNEAFGQWYCSFTV